MDCPKCKAPLGLEVARDEDRPPWKVFMCGTTEFSDGSLVCGMACYDNQLAQRDSRIAELEAKYALAVEKSREAAATATELAGDSAEAAGEMVESRRPSANDRAVERIKAYLAEADPHHLSVHGRVMAIIREEAERHE